MASFDIRVRTRGSLNPGREPAAFASGYTGVVVCTDDETGAETRVGKVAALRVHAAHARAAGVPLFDVCDAHSHELHVLHALLYSPDGYHFRDAVAARFGATESDLLVLDYVVLAPKWRQLKLGLLAVRRLVELIGGGCGLAVSLIAPLRTDAHAILGVPASWLPPHADAADRRAAAATLRKYYRRMGFARLGRTPYYALALGRRAPSVGEILGGE